MTKKDYNYMAAMEKAVSEKYGKTAVQDFRSDWTDEDEKNYLQQLRERHTSKSVASSEKCRTEIGDVIIRKRSNFKKPNRTCPVCKTYSFSLKDDLYMNRFKSCYRCYIDFVEHRKDKWDEGWRPTDEQVAEALTRRKK